MDVLIPKRSDYPQGKGVPLWKNSFFFVNKTIERLFTKNKTVNDEKLTAQVNPEEGFFIYELIVKNKFKKCLEIGMANGLSSLYICQALSDLNQKDSFLISIDPFQTKQWKSAGIKHINEAGLQKYHNLIEKLDTIALPEIYMLVKEGLEKFDFIFIDGDHRFDYTLLDFMYSDYLLKIGGVIVVDDVKHENVKACMNYVDSNYRHFKKLKGPNASKTMNLYIKMSEDMRDWNFHMPFKG